MIRQLTLYLAFAIGLGFVQEVHASAFYLNEHSVSSMGNAYAGAAAVAEDATTVYFNPAGMTSLCPKGDLDYQSAFGAYLIFPSIRFQDDGSTYNPCPPTVPPSILLGGNGHNAGEPALVGNAYFVQKYRCRGLATGLGITSPFGLVTDYGHRWRGRYFAIRSALLTININPAIAYRINNCWSIGAGFNVMYLHAKVTNAVDFGAILSCSTGGVLGIPQEQDGKAIIKGDSWGYGANAGILYEPRCGTRIGLSFRSEIKHHITGSESFKDIPEEIELVPPLAAVFQNTRAKANATLPSIAELSGYHELNSCWALLWDISWFKWKVFKRLRFRFSNEFQEDSEITLQWKNSLKYAIGTTYRPSSCLAYRFGLAYDQSPVRSRKLATPRVPDTDRIWLAFGTGYDYGPLHFDLAYIHIFTAKDAKIDKTGLELPEDQFRGGLKGRWRSHLDLVGVQMIANF
ncbi:MAG: outer membrane protein transport protein [Waddliaceae bacterium]